MEGFAVETIGKVYGEEIKSFIDNDFIEPWSLNGFETKPISLDCSLNEIEEIWFKNASHREGFDINKADNIVNLPHLYVRIKGVIDNFEEKGMDLYELIQFFDKNSIHVEIMDGIPTHTSVYLKCIQDRLDKNMVLDIDDIPRNIQSKSWFHKLNESMQTYILHKLNEFAKEHKDAYNIPLIVLNLSLMEKDMAEGLNNWQFYNEVPKVFVKDVGNLTGQTLEWLDFLSYLGLDIMIFSPMGELLPQKKGYCKDLKSFTLDKFDMEYDNPEKQAQTKKPKEDSKEDDWLWSASIVVFIFVFGSIGIELISKLASLFSL
jgi:hypothetical protein